MEEADLSYDSLERELAEAGIALSLPELHGGVCGVMCMGGLAAAGQWLDECLKDTQAEGDRAVSEVLRALELGTWRMLTSQEMIFEPMLPDDDQPLEEQVRGLALWCHGFLTGLGFGGMKTPAESLDSSGTLAEITRDFAEISRAILSPDDADDPQQSGFALGELKEYVRVGVQLVFEQFGGRQLDADTDSVH